MGVKHALVGVVLLSFVLVPSSGFAQTMAGGPVLTQTQRPTPPAPKRAASTQIKPDPGMTNEAVIKMVKAGLSEELIIGSIKAATKKAFNVSPDGLIALKTAGVSDKIMMVMSGIEPPPAPPAVVPTAPLPAPNAEPAAPAREPGFYVLVDGKEVPLDSSVITGGKTGTSKMFLTAGLAKAKLKAVVKGERSSMRVPVQADLIFVAGSGLSQPKDISIIKFRIEDKSRVFQTGEAGAFSGVSTGINDKDCVPYKAEKIGPDTYKFLLDKPLPAGEYALVDAAMVQVSAAGATGKVWDFGVDK